MTNILDSLPSELFRSILKYLSPEDAIALSQTCRRMHQVVQDEHIWQEFYLKRYKYFQQSIHYSVDEYLPNSALKPHSLPLNDCTWQDTFRQRAIQDQHIRKLFNEILIDRSCRTQNASYLSSTYGLLCFDVLKTYFPSENSSQSIESRRFTREYYSFEIARLISRDIGLNLLNDIKQQTHNLSSTYGKALINGLYAIQCFHPHGLFLNLNSLDQIAQQIVTDDYFQQANLREKCQLILSKMKLEQFLPAINGTEYYDLENSFLYSTFHGKPTIPLTLVAVFCAIADQCGLKARPVGFPGEVMAQVDSSTDSNQHGLIVSVFDNKITSLEEINERLSHVLDEPLTYPLPMTSIRELVIRSARNILNSITRHSTSSLDSYGLYATVAVMKILDDTALPFTFDSMINILKEQFQFDTKLFEMFLSNSIINEQNSNAIQIKPRRQNAPQFSIGQIFQHRQYHYWAVISGWDYICAATPIWQVRMGVANLLRGASQPFYYTLASDQSKRYVPEDNIDVLAFDSIENQEEKYSIIEKLCTADEIGKYFDRIDLINGKFRANSELCQEYPDDCVPILL